jgi:hypothetical protein
MSSTVQEELLKKARDAFEHACTLREDERIEVYIIDDTIYTSNVLKDTQTIDKEHALVCYSVHGHDFLEPEIIAYIDQARQNIQSTKTTDEHIKDLVTTLAKKRGKLEKEISSSEVFANLPMTLLGSIEQDIIEYWWSAPQEENGKSLALNQINHALSKR